MNNQTFDFDVAWITSSILDENLGNSGATHTGLKIWFHDELIFPIQEVLQWSSTSKKV
jgi:hypothetical protein